VKQNVAAFGGDPANVTIYGESAGSLDVCLHVASPASHDLFHAAISESGGCTTFQALKASGEDTTAKLSAAVGCDAKDLACLRTKSVSDLLNAAGGAGTFGPTAGTEFLPMQPRAAFDAGQINKVPYILGSNTDEGTLFTLTATNVNNQDAYRTALKGRYPAIADQVEMQYPASDFMSEQNPYLAAFARAIGDSVLVCSTWDAAVRAAKAGAPTWMYNFDIPANVPGLGATHGSELVYVFGTSPNLMPEQQKVADIMQGYWTNFAKNKDPNKAPLPDWPSFSADHDKRINLSVMPSTVSDFRSDKCKFWQGVYDAQFTSGT
jgi:para-nitrobenzyl esterase